MSFSKPNFSPATNTKLRNTPSPFAGLCVVCLDGCPGYCEVGKSAIRGREVIYPQPFGKTTSGSEKDYPVDYSHLNIQGSCIGAQGIEADSDIAIFPNVSVETEVAKGKIKLKVPYFTGALGSTDIARIHWEGAACGAAITGSIVVCGENVCGMDEESEIKNGKVVKSPEMERRVNSFKKLYEGYGDILVQLNVEDTRLGVAEYVIEKLGVQTIELKWGQGAKDIGGEVKLKSLEKAILLKKRGYVVLPDPEDPISQKAFKEKEFKEFERHSRLGMVEAESFLKEAERLRKQGAKFVTLKTGAYKATELALAVKLASEAKIDLLTVDGAGGGTGMSPWRMMNEWGIPTIYIEAMLYNFLNKLKKKGKFVPDCAIAGGFVLEDQIFKGLALGAPYIKAICMGRATLTAAHVANNLAKSIKKGHTLPEWQHFGDSLEEVFIDYEELKAKYGKEFKHIPSGAIGMYSFYKRLALGLKQLMAGARKFTLKNIDRTDLISLTKECAEVTKIPYIMEADMAEAEKILS